MYEMLIEFCVARPGRLSATGRAVVQLSGIILLVGFCGRIATVGVSAIQGMGGAKPYETVFFEDNFGSEFLFIFCSDATGDSVCSQNHIVLFVH